MIWSVAGQATRCRKRDAKKKFKTLPNLRVGLPQFSRVRSVPGQFFKGCGRPLCLRCNASPAPLRNCVTLIANLFVVLIRVLRARGFEPTGCLTLRHRAA